MTSEENEGETVFSCVVCGKEIRPVQGDEFKHVQDSKTGRNLVFCGEDGTFLAQLIQMDLQDGSELLNEVREMVAELYDEQMD